MDREPRPSTLVKASLIALPETVLPVASDSRDARARRRRHRWMLLLAFEVMVFGCTQAVMQPIKRPGISVEQVFTPNHVVT